VQGLLPHLEKNCLTDYAGQPFESLDQAYQHALPEELCYTSTNAKGRFPATSNVATLQGRSKRLKVQHFEPGNGNAGRGSGRSTATTSHARRGVAYSRGGRGGHETSGRLPPEREVIDWSIKCTRCHGRGHVEAKCPSITRAMQR
jgi:hypothetical protein